MSYQRVHRSPTRARICTPIHASPLVLTFQDAIADEKPPATSWTAVVNAGLSEFAATIQSAA
jgi:hypothetical protein